MSDLEEAKNNLLKEFTRIKIDYSDFEPAVRGIVDSIPKSHRDRYNENDYIAAWECYSQWAVSACIDTTALEREEQKRMSEISRQKLYELLTPMGFVGIAVETASRMIYVMALEGRRDTYAFLNRTYHDGLRYFPKWLIWRDASYREIDVNLCNTLARLGYAGEAAINFINLIVYLIPSYARKNFSGDLYTAAWECLPKLDKHNRLKSVDDELYELLALHGIVESDRANAFIRQIESSIPSEIRHIYSKDERTAALEYFPTWEKIHLRIPDTDAIENAKQMLTEKLASIEIVVKDIEPTVERIVRTIPDESRDLYNQNKYVAALEYFPEWKEYIHSTSIYKQLHERLARIGRDTDDLEDIVYEIVFSIPSEIRNKYSDGDYTAALEYLPEWEKLQSKPVDTEIASEQARQSKLIEKNIDTEIAHLKILEKLGHMGIVGGTADGVIDKIVNSIPTVIRSRYSDDKYIAALEYFPEWEKLQYKGSDKDITPEDAKYKLIEKLGPMGYIEDSVDIAVERIVYTIPMERRDLYSNNKYIAALEFFPKWEEHIKTMNIKDQFCYRLACVGICTTDTEAIADRIVASIPSAIRSRYSADKYTAALEYLPEWNRLMNL